jgi:outer membrane immunogenic protein
MKTKMVIAVAGLLMLPEVATSARLNFPPAVASNSASSSSWLAGAQMGYNWQRGSLIYGFEADMSGLDLDSQMNTTLPRFPSFLPPVTANTTSGIDWYGTVRGRLGWAAGPMMFYGTGGLAYGRTNVNSTLTDTFFPVSLNTQSSSVKTGWVAGFGFEYLLRPNLILNVGYQYVDLGSTSVVGSSPDGSLQQGINAHGQFQVVTVGLSWLFQPAGGSAVVDGPKYAKAPYVKAPVAAVAPWEGFYAGGHAGGAWGNRTNADYVDSNVILASDIRLKRDITLVGRRDDGLGLYSYRYLWSDTVYVGVMAQEVALVHPEAIVRGELDDYLRVDYSRLGLRLMTLPDWDAKRKGDTL